MTRSKSTDLRDLRSPFAKYSRQTMIAADHLISTDRSDILSGRSKQVDRNGSETFKAGVDLPQFLAANAGQFRRTIRRHELRQIVPLADTTIYDMERRGEFPRRFNLTSRCVVWDLAEVEAWVEARRQAANTPLLKRAPTPDVRRRKRRPVKAVPGS